MNRQRARLGALLIASVMPMVIVRRTPEQIEQAGADWSWAAPAPLSAASHSVKEGDPIGRYAGWFCHGSPSDISGRVRPRPGTGEPHGTPGPTPGRCAGRDRTMRLPPPILPGSMRAGAKRATFWTAGLLVVAAVLIAPANTAANDPLGLDLMALGQTIPVFELPPVENGEPGLSDADLTGQVSLLNVWASWCPPCRDEHPVLMDLAERDLVPLFGLNYKDAAPSAARWLREDGDPYQSTGFDGDGRVTTELGLFGVPQTFVIDRAGRIAYVHRGALDEDAVERIILPLVERLSRQDGAAPKQPDGRRSTGRSP